MTTTEHQLKELLDAFGREIVESRNPFRVSDRECIDQNIPSAPGVYWIETTMPAEEMRSAISRLSGKNRRLRTKPPRGTHLIEQSGSSPYVAYSGTEENMRKRLRQHLFNEGHEKTVKLGCVISEAPFSEYEWRVWFKEITSYELRYAVEAWWRLNRGWPAFCLR